MTPAARAAAHSHLFTVRLWRDDLGSGQVEWRGQVTHVLSGEARWFREWAELAESLVAMALRQEQADEADATRTRRRPHQHPGVDP